MNRKIILVLLFNLGVNFSFAKEQAGLDLEIKTKYQRLKKLGAEIVTQVNSLEDVRQKMEDFFAKAKVVKKQKLLLEKKFSKMSDSDLEDHIDTEILKVFNDYFDSSKKEPVVISEPFLKYFKDLLDEDEVRLLKFYAIKYTFDLMDVQEALNEWDKLADTLMNFGRKLSL